MFSASLGPVKIWRLALVLGIFALGIVGWVNGWSGNVRPLTPVGVTFTPVPGRTTLYTALGGLHVCARRDDVSDNHFCLRSTAVLTQADINGGARVSFVLAGGAGSIPSGAYTLLLTDRGPHTQASYADEAMHIYPNDNAVSFPLHVIIDQSGVRDAGGLVRGDTYGIQLDPGEGDGLEHQGYTTFVYDPVVKLTRP